MGKELQCGRAVDNPHNPYAVLWDTSFVAFPDRVQCFCRPILCHILSNNFLLWRYFQVRLTFSSD